MKRWLAWTTLTLAGLAHPGHAWAAAPQLQVEQGTLSGKAVNGVQQFLGVPFAAPPVGPLRWQPPQPPVWSGTRDATAFGPVCAQGGAGSEDCLTLNIYRPPNAQGAPLVVWVHGGFFTGGDASLFDGSALARERGVVVATVNYRLGVYGFLAVPGVTDGNNGLYDILAAVRWLRQNAASLGADAGNITLAGQSAGAAAICTLLAAPSAAGLFQKAILQSGSCAAPIFHTPLNDARRKGDLFARALRCDRGDVAACLRGKSRAELDAVRLTGRSPIDPVPLPPVYGDALIPRRPQDVFARGEGLKVAVLLGINREEGQIFEPYLPELLRGSRTLYRAGLALINPWQAWTLGERYPLRGDEPPIRAVTRLLTDQVFACPTAWLAGKLAAGRSGSGLPTYFYEFSDPRPPLQLAGKVTAPNLGAYHGAELAYVLDTPVVGVADPAQFSPAQARLAAQMGEYWTNFARSGQPASLGLTVWPTFNPASPQVMTLEPGATALRPNFDGRHQCDYWNAAEGRP